jgi:CheY-like chemotaxis protein
MNLRTDRGASPDMAGSDRRIVLADPFPDECGMYVEMLRGRGFEVCVVPTTLADALREITRDPPHLVITRIRPWRFGIELIAAMKREPATAAVATLALTTSILPEMTRDARAAGADEVLLLPAVEFARASGYRSVSGACTIHTMAPRVAARPQ